MTRRLLALALLFLCGCHSAKAKQKDAGGAAADATASAAPTYHDIKSVLDAKCVGCHATGGSAPFPLTSFAEAQPHASAIKAAVVSHTMPPWRGERGCNTYKNDVSLLPAELDQITKWVDGGAKQGPDASGPATPALRSEMSRIDVELPMKDAYMPTKEPDEYRCFVLDWSPSDTVYVTGFGTRPGNLRIVHHVIAFLIPPAAAGELAKMDGADGKEGYECFGGPGTSAQPSWVGAWAPGLGDADYPEGTGLKIAPGSKVVLQVHYNLQGKDAKNTADLSTVLLRLEKSVEKEAYILPWANFGWITNPATMAIPAGQASVVHSFAADPTPILNGKAFDVHMAILHMHNLGKSALLRLAGDAPANDTCLLDIRRWSFAWQSEYWLETPVRVQPGMKLGVECEWDNSAANQPLIDGKPKTPVDIKWGEGTSDEMCLAGVYITPAD